MSSYDLLDIVADAYNPLLGVTLLVFISLTPFKESWKHCRVRFLSLLIVMLIAYGLMFFDNYFALWTMLGLDYSTHTAAALGLVICLSFAKPKLVAFWVGSFICYVLLMLYQGYHTISDILITGFAAAIPMWLTLAYIHKLAGLRLAK